MSLMLTSPSWDSLSQLLAKDNRYYPDFVIDSVYFGGGNPGILEPVQTLDLLKIVRDNYEVLPTAEISIEFDPVMVAEEKLSALQVGGFNRISMGVQSLDDQILEKVGRVHTGQDAIDAHELMKKADMALYDCKGKGKNTFRFYRD